MEVKDYFDALFSVEANEEYAEQKKFQICKDLVEKYRTGAFRNVSTEELFMRTQPTTTTRTTNSVSHLSSDKSGKQNSTRLTHDEVDTLSTIFSDLVNSQAMDIQKQLTFYQNLKRNKRDIIRQAQSYIIFLSAKITELETNSQRMQGVLTNMEDQSIQDDENKIRLRSESYYFETREFNYRSLRIDLLKQLNQSILKKVASTSITPDLRELLIVYNAIIFPELGFVWKEFKAELKRGDLLHKLQELNLKSLRSDEYNKFHHLFHDEKYQNYFLAANQKPEIILMFQFMSYLFFEYEYNMKKQDLIKFLKTGMDDATSTEEEIDRMRENFNTLKFKLIELRQIKTSEEEKIEQLQGELTQLGEFVDWLRQELKKNRNFASTALSEIRGFKYRNGEIPNGNTNGRDK